MKIKKPYMVPSERIHDSAKTVSKLHSDGRIDRSEFCLKIFNLWFNLPLPDWGKMMDNFTEGQREIIRSFADDYFLHNGYMPRPDPAEGASAAELEEAARSDRGKWMKLHQRIVQATGG